MVLGGGALSIYYDNIREYYLREGVIPKIVDLSEFVIHLEAELVVRYAFKLGLELSSQFNYLPLFFSLLNPFGNYKERWLALRSRIVITTFNLMGKYLRDISDRSKLIRTENILGLPKFFKINFFSDLVFGLKICYTFSYD